MPGPIPKPTDDDHEDVHWALTTANSLQAQGDHAEALRWLRRAASAAQNNEDAARAEQLGRSAIELEAALSGARTMRVAPDGASNAALEAAKETVVDSETTVHGMLERSGVPRGTYDLDQPTHVDSSPPSSHSISDDRTQAEAGLPSTDREITLVPFTMKAGTAPPAHDRRPTKGTGTLQLEESPLAQDDAPTSVDGSTPELYVDPPDGNTLAMKAAPNEDELAITDSMPRAPISETATALAPVPRHRVALLASPDGHDPRVMLLRDGMRAPAGAGIAFLIPASSRDAGTIANLLDHHKKK